MPPLMSNHGNYIVSLGNVCRWLATQAEALGVEIYPGFPAADIVYGDKGEVRGVVTGDLGVARDGHHKDSYTPGMNLLGKYTLFAEGARGSLTKRLGAKFGLHEGRDLSEVRHRPERTVGTASRSITSVASSCTRSAGRWTMLPAAACSCITGARISAPSVSSFI